MELGIDKKQIEAARQWAQDLAADRVRLRFAVCLVMVVLGWMLVLKPQADALAAARTSLGKAHTQAKRATDAVFYTNQVERYEPYLFTDDDPVTLQSYVLGHLEASGATIRGTSPKKTEPRGVFKVVELELEATGTFAQLVDLVDRLEHGPKVLRLERLRLERNKTAIFLTCTVNGLAKPPLSAGKSAGKGSGEGSGEAPPAEADGSPAADGVAGDGAPAVEGVDGAVTGDGAELLTDPAAAGATGEPGESSGSSEALEPDGAIPPLEAAVPPAGGEGG